MSDRSGLSILELMGVIAVMTVVINVAAMVFISATRMNAVGMTRMEETAAQRILCDTVRETIRGAVAVMPSLGERTTGADAVVLRMPNVEGHETYCVFSRDEAERGISRLEFRRIGEDLQLIRAKTLVSNISSHQFAYGSANPADARLVTLRIKWEGTPEDSPMRVITAALRGQGSPVP